MLENVELLPKEGRMARLIPLWSRAHYSTRVSFPPPSILFPRKFRFQLDAHSRSLALNERLFVGEKKKKKGEKGKKGAGEKKADR